MQLGKTGRQIALNFEPWRELELIMMIILWVMGWFNVSAVVFMRRDFGERYLSWLNLFFGYTVVALFCGIGNYAIGMATGTGFSTTMGLFYFSFLAVSLFHRWIIWQKNKQGVEWHSLYSGESLLPVPFSPETIQKWIEPALCFALSLIVRPLIPALGIWLLFAAFAMLIHAHITFHLQRQRILDMVDAKIEAKYMQSVMSGKRAQETGGFAIAQSNLRMIKSDAKLEEIISRMPAEVLGMLDDSTPTGRLGAAA